MLPLWGACQWMAPHGALGSPDDSTSTASASYRALQARLVQLQKQTQSQQLDLAKTRAELAQRDEIIAGVRADLESTRSDLNYAERQFVTIERGLMREESRASAVSAIAEVRLLRERVIKSDTTAYARELSAQVDKFIQTADRLVTKQNYTAAVYYANRATRMLHRTDRRMLREVVGPALVVSVSRANLRGGPSSKYDVLGHLDYGVVVTQLELKGEWYHVRTRSGTDGWVHRSLVR